MPKTQIDYDAFCGQLQIAVERANPIAVEDDPPHRYQISRLDEFGPFHLCLMRGEEPVVFHLARVLMRVFYEDMAKADFMTLADSMVSGRTSIEFFDAIPVYVLYEAFCEAPE